MGLGQYPGQLVSQQDWAEHARAATVSLLLLLSQTLHLINPGKLRAKV